MLSDNPELVELTKNKFFMINYLMLQNFATILFIRIATSMIGLFKIKTILALAKT